MVPLRLASDRPLLCQLVLLGMAAGVLAGWPPRRGALMLVPIGSRAAGTAVPLAVAAGARLVGPGPLPGSYVVRADRDALAGPMLRAGVLTLPALSAGCAGGGAAA